MKEMVKLVLLLICLSSVTAVFSMCPNGQPPRQCSNPCRGAFCHGFHGAHCIPDYCRCYPMFYDGHGQKINCQNRWKNYRYNYRNRYYD